MNFVVNASAAKFGGAREILISFLNGVSTNNGDTYNVFCPAGSDLPKRKNIRYSFVKTGGFGTVFFTIFCMIFICLVKRAKIAISFNNYNIPLPLCRRITYFHQEKIFDSSGLRLKLIKFLVVFFHGDRVVVQSDRIKDLLVNKLSIESGRIDVKWPGVRAVTNIDKVSAARELSSRFSLDFKDKKIAFLPVYDHLSTHKDFMFWRSVSSGLSRLGFVTVSLCDPSSRVANMNLGRVDRSLMDFIYSVADVLVIISKKETLCLPVFEFSQKSRLVIARESDFIFDFLSLYPEWLRNVLVFPPHFDEDDFVRIISNYSPHEVSKTVLADMLKGDWDF